MAVGRAVCSVLHVGWGAPTVHTCSLWCSAAWQCFSVFEVQADIVVQSLSRVRLFATPWTAARQASLKSNSLLAMAHYRWARESSDTGKQYNVMAKRKVLEPDF